MAVKQRRRHTLYGSETATITYSVCSEAATNIFLVYGSETATATYVVWQRDSDNYIPGMAARQRRFHTWHGSETATITYLV